MNKDYYQDRSLKYGIGGTRRRRIFELVGGIRDKKVLDIGCATGYVGSELKKTGNYVVGIDISEPSVKQAKLVLNKHML